MARKNLICFTFSLILIVTLLPLSVLADGVGLSNFKSMTTLQPDTFTDVNEDDWFYDNVKFVYEKGLMTGAGEGIFNPQGDVKLSETVAIAARLHMIYTLGHEINATPLNNGSGNWYDRYVDYAKKNGILAEDYDEYNRPATREEFADIISFSLPAGEMTAKNDIADGAIPDVTDNEAVYLLYRAGILTGSDDSGAFLPESTIKRSHVAAIVSRIVDLGLREDVVIPTKDVDGSTETKGDTVDYTYDESGHIITEKYYTDGKLSYKLVNTYSSIGKKVLVKRYEADGKMSQETRYGASGMIVQDSVFSSSRLISKTDYEVHGNTVYSMCTEYDKYSDDPISNTYAMYTKDFVLTYSITHDAEYRIIRRAVFKGTEHIEWEEYSYEKSGSCLVMKIDTYDLDGNLTKYRKEEFDEKGNVLSDVTYRTDGSIMREIEYDSNNERMKATYYNSRGTMYKWVEYTYTTAPCGKINVTLTTYDRYGKVQLSDYTEDRFNYNPIMKKENSYN